MADKLGLTQELRLTQRLSPLQIQTIKLLSLPIQELEQTVRGELEENPMLEEDKSKEESRSEEDKDLSIDSLKEDDYIPSYKTYVNNFGKDEVNTRNTLSVKEGFTQSLMDQLGCRELDEHRYSIGSFIIGSLDSDGYLRRDISSLVDDMAFRAGIETTEDEVLEVLSIIQEFEPYGVGARNLQECLLLQLKMMTPGKGTDNATKLLTKFFNEFTNKHYQKIIARSGMSEDDIKEAIRKITKLNPYPGGQIDDSYNDQAQQIIPDFVLDYDNEEFHLSMPKYSVPELKVNKKYANMLIEAAGKSEREQKEAVLFVKRKLDQAKWYIEAIQQRHNTLETTMKAILDYQREYFADGDESNLKPMVLKDIAEKTGYDISTISRVVNSKYIETHFGIMPLKYFFSEGLENQDGEEISTREVKKTLMECIEKEDKKKPLTDDSLVKILEGKGYKVARRTIAKYRDQLNIPKARLRKEI